MNTLNKTAVAGVLIAAILPTLAMAHPGHPDAGLAHGLLHGWEYLILSAIAAFAAARLLRRR